LRATGWTLDDKATLERLLSAIVFVIPIAVLLTLIFLWLSRRRNGRGVPPPPPNVPNEPFRAVPQPPAAAHQTIAETAELPPRTKADDIDAISNKIENAIACGEKTSLSALYLDLAGGHERLGNVEDRMSALRSAAGYGAHHGPPAAHAAARLALAESAHQAGDLTSACEQWQMARTAFLQSGETEQHARVEKRMRENGCPTDWVLTDF
jgi:hypothetical protein